MIFVDNNSLTLRNILSKIKDDPKSDFVDTTISDFNQTLIHISCKEASGPLQISLFSPSIKAIQAAYDLQDHLKLFLQQTSLNLTKTEDSFDVSFTLAKGNLIDEKIELIGDMRAKIFEIPLKTAMEANLSGLVEEPFALPIQGSEMLYIKPYADRIMVTISVAFEDPSDVVIGKVFLQELFDTRQKHSLQNSPSVILGKEPPMEISDMVINKKSESPLDYISFVFSPRHFEDEEKRARTISLVMNFRTYLHYHLKCTKAYLHTRMRGKVDELLNVLDRAKLEYSSQD